MHHVRVALDEHQPLDFHRAVFADAAKIVAAEVDEHDVFGALFGIGEKLGFEFAVLFFGAAARHGAGDGAVEGVAALDFDQHFGRAACYGNVAEAKEVKIG